MTTHTIYDAVTGEIKRVSEQVDHSAGEAAIEGEYSASTHYVKRGEALPLPPKMNDEPVFDYLLERWVDQAGGDPRPILDRRQKLLRDSDWTQLPDVPLSTKQLWAAYRQALRDITSQPGYPLHVVWPVPPSNDVVFEVGSM